MHMLFYWFLTLSMLPIATTLLHTNRSFTITYDKNTFMKDGEPFRYISAEMHYFRVPRIHWQDRLQKIRKAGLNAIQTYVAWNLHEMFKGSYNFEDELDIVAFIKLAQAEDLVVILRPGPYICAEWEYGGFPYWLIKEVPFDIRTTNKLYMSYVDQWFSVLLSKLKPYLYSNGGPIITVQVEDEYGSYECDHGYMLQMQNVVEKYLGTDVVLFTTEGAYDSVLRCGTIESLYTTVDFGINSDVAALFEIQRKYQPKGPLVNSEYYTGWFDHWGEGHHTTSSDSVARDLDTMLSLGASVNLYMFEGGTNFGMMNGANSPPYSPVTTSYSYDGPLTEAGDPNEKYFAIQKVVSKYSEIPPGPQPKPTLKMAYGKVSIQSFVAFYDILGYLKSYTSTQPETFEALDLAVGYMLYRTNISGLSSSNNMSLAIPAFHDRAIILVDEKYVEIIHRNHNKNVTIPPGITLDILIENEGRIAHGHQMTDNSKGILASVTLDGKILEKWQMFPYGVTKHDSGMMTRTFSSSVFSTDVTMGVDQEFPNCPMFGLFIFYADVAEDTFLKLEHWTKGFAVVNGKFLQKYWTTAGPQQTLYIPKSAIIEKGENKVVVFETDRAPDRMENANVEFVDAPVFKYSSVNSEVV